MTKLYHNSQLWQLPGKQDKKAERHDVPSSPEELAAWLNDRAVPAHGRAVLLEAPAENPRPIDDQAGEPDPADDWRAERERLARCSICKSLLTVSVEGADKLAISHDLTKISDWLDVAPNWAIERLTESVLERAREYRNRGEAN